MVLVESDLNNEQVSLKRRIYTEKCIFVLKQVDLVARVIFISGGRYSGTSQYNFANFFDWIFCYN